MSLSENSATIRKRNQLTLPAGVAAALGVSEGDVLSIVVEGGTAILRPVRRSYAGTLEGVYGDPEAFLKRERDEW